MQCQRYPYFYCTRVWSRFVVYQLINPVEILIRKTAQSFNTTDLQNSETTAERVSQSSEYRLVTPAAEHLANHLGQYTWPSTSQSGRSVVWLQHSTHSPCRLRLLVFRYENNVYAWILYVQKTIAFQPYYII